VVAVLVLCAKAGAAKAAAMLKAMTVAMDFIGCAPFNPGGGQTLTIAVAFRCTISSIILHYCIPHGVVG
jgi:hypothetical protein